MSLTIQVPTVGVANSTEAVKVTNSLTNLNVWANGNIPDTDLASPNNAVRRVLLQAFMSPSTVTGTTLQLLDSTGVKVANGNNGVPLLYQGDTATDFAVAGKTAYARVRATIATNTVAPTVNIVFGLYPVATFAGTSGQVLTTVSTTAVTGSTVTFTTPGASASATAASSQFALPTSAGTSYVLCVSASGTAAVGSGVGATVQLLLYSA